jgi:acetyl-CoA C-acetyltransferase
MLKEIRNNHLNIGLVTGVSGMMTKQAFALWAKEPLMQFISKDVTKQAALIEYPIEMSTQNNGEAVILGYTIFKDVDKGMKVVIYGEDSQKNRKVLISKDKEIIKNMGEEEWVGKQIVFKGKYLVS